ncbi:MAG: MATE family efflux transporter [bacterium]
MTEEKKTHGGGKDFTTGSIPRNLLHIALPMLLGNLLQTMYMVVNRIWVGHFLGPDAMAAVTNSFPVFFIMMAIINGMTIASSILVSQYYGAKQIKDLRRVVNTSWMIILGMSIVLTVLGTIFAHELLTLIHTPPEIMQQTEGFLKLLFLTMPVQFTMFLLVALLRGIGDTISPLYFQSIFLVLTAILDPILIFGMFGLPKCGINGTMYATLITMSGGLISLALFMRRKQSPVSPSWLKFCFDKPTAKMIFKIGLPSAFQQILVSAQFMMMTYMINQFGTNASAAFGAGMTIDNIAFMPAMLMGMAISSVAGQNIGIEKFNRAGTAFYWGMIISGGITLIIALSAALFPHVLLMPFIKSDSQIVMNYAMDYLRVMAISYMIYSIMFSANGVMNGAGMTLITTISTVVGLWVVRVPLAYYLSGLSTGNWWFSFLPHRNRDIHGIWIAMVAGVAVSAVLSLIFFYSGMWKKSLVKKEIPKINHETSNCGCDIIDNTACE